MRLLAKAALIVPIIVGPSYASVAVSHHTVESKCPPKHAHVLVASSDAEVYEARNVLSQPEIYGCTQRGGHRSVLGAAPECTSSGCGGVEEASFALAGVVVAYEYVSSSPGSESWIVIVRDLRNGRLLHRLPTGTPIHPGEVGGGFTRGIVVKRDGAVAWIVAGGVARGGNAVRVVDKAGSRVLASSTDVAPDSLALAGSTLYWTQAGSAFSATLE